MSRTLAFLDGGGEMGERIRSHNWTGNALGAPETWPCSLRTAVGLIIRMAQPAYIAWGPKQISLYNDGYIPIVGTRHPKGLGQPAHEMWAEIWDTLGPLNEAVFAGEALYFEDMPFALGGQDLEPRSFNFSYTPLLNDTGEIAGIFCVALETTGKVHAAKIIDASEKALNDLNRSLAQQVAERTQERDRLWRNTQDIQLITDGAAVIRATNPAFMAVLGWTLEDVIGKSIFEFIIPDDGVSLKAVERLRSQKLLVVENRYRHKEGGFRWLAWVGTPDGEWFYGSGRDITAEKEQADALAIAEEALRQAQKMEAVGQLTGGLAHDFNNLLASISGALQVLKLKMQLGQHSGLERYIEIGESSVRRAASLTQRLLAFSRRQTLDPKPTDVNRLIAGMEELVRRSVGPTVELEVIDAPDLWRTKVDPPQLENALLNLCINARDAMMPEGGKLVLETANKRIDEQAAEPNMPPGQYISLSVSDTGTGMSPDVVARIFDPFYTTKPLGEGTGLGLSMVYGFVRQSGGHVRVSSKVECGTTMCLFLPRYAGAAPVEVAVEALSLASGQGETILLIEDERALRDIIEEILCGAGYRVLTAQDGPTGLHILNSDASVDLLVTDVGLPGGLNGRQVADAARVQRPGLKVLFITGYADTAAVGNGRLESGMEVMTKPFDIGAFARKVRALIDSRQPV